MDFKEYLLTQKDFHLRALASLMWPKNKAAESYLSKKLNGKDGREFTLSDEKKAREALEKLGFRLIDASKR